MKKNHAILRQKIFALLCGIILFSGCAYHSSPAQSPGQTRAPLSERDAGLIALNYCRDHGYTGMQITHTRMIAGHTWEVLLRDSDRDWHMRAKVLVAAYDGHVVDSEFVFHGAPTRTPRGSPARRAPPHRGARPVEPAYRDRDPGQQDTERYPAPAARPAPAERSDETSDDTTEAAPVPSSPADQTEPEETSPARPSLDRPGTYERPSVPGRTTPESPVQRTPHRPSRPSAGDIPARDIPSQDEPSVTDPASPRQIPSTGVSRPADSETVREAVHGKESETPDKESTADSETQTIRPGERIAPSRPATPSSNEENDEEDEEDDENGEDSRRAVPSRLRPAPAR